MAAPKMAQTLSERAADVRDLERDFELVLDTNVLLEMFSIGDLNVQCYRVADEGIEDPMSDPLCRHRIGRTFHAQALAVKLQRLGAETFSLGDEAEMGMLRLVPTEDPSEPDYHYNIHLVCLVKDLLLPDWTPTVTQNFSGDLRNQDRDKLLLEVARTLEVPLVTNEGNTHKGLRNRGLRKLAKDGGVDVLCPRELNERWGVDTREAWRWLLGEFERQARGYLKTFEQSKLEVMQRGLGQLRDIFEVVAQVGEEAADPR